MYLRTPQQLDQFAHHVVDHGVLCIDMEFIPERTYYPELALIQVAAGDQAALVDPLAVDDLTPIWDLISNPEVIKVVHAGWQDMAIFYNRTGTVPKTVFDTQVAAAFVGHGHQISLANLVNAALGVYLPKGQGITNWLKRPLSTKQEKYAINDVVHLEALFTHLHKQLENRHRLPWVQQELTKYQEPTTYERPLSQAINRIKKGGLDATQQSVLAALAAWREEIARQQNRPRRQIIPDHLLVELAKRRPTPASFGQIRGIQSFSKYKNEICRTIRNVVHQAAIPKETPAAAPLTSKQKTVVNLLMFLFTELCSKEGLAPAYVGNRADVEELVTLGTSPLLSGWRKELIGQHLEKCLAGKLVIAINADDQSVMFEDR